MIVDRKSEVTSSFGERDREDGARENGSNSPVCVCVCVCGGREGGREGGSKKCDIHLEEKCLLERQQQGPGITLVVTELSWWLMHANLSMAVSE